MSPEQSTPSPIHAYTPSLHDALPIYLAARRLVPGQGRDHGGVHPVAPVGGEVLGDGAGRVHEVADHQGVGDAEAGQGLTECDWVDRKSTRLNSSHVSISYAVLCLKNK